MRNVVASLLLAAGCSFPDYALDQPVTLESCRDGLLNGAELIVDCGPGCDAGCGTDQLCTQHAECGSGSCHAGRCSLPSCSDGLRNRSESDVDCGGVDGCQACAVGQRCDSVNDCDGGACMGERCQPPSCRDGLRNGDETDVDCGGDSGCARCSAGAHCDATTDCELSTCARGRCQEPACDDGVMNGDETDVDCGGSCAACLEFSRCEVGHDCHSLVCGPGGRCLPPTCQDGVMNGSEPSIDCGRTCSEKCAMTLPCGVDADCKSGACQDGRCMPAAPTGVAIAGADWSATASDTFSAATPPSRAIDGNFSTHWTSGAPQVAGMWFQIDMREARPFFSVDVRCTSNSDYPRKIRLLASQDGQAFTPVTTTVAGESNLRLELSKAHAARYLKLELQEDAGGPWWRIDELVVRE